MDPRTSSKMPLNQRSAIFICCLAIRCLFPASLFCQNISTDIKLIQTYHPNQQSTNHQKADNDHKAISYKSKSAFVRHNPVNLAFSGMMLVYQNVISPQYGSNCQHKLTCSNFSKKAIGSFGLIKGIALSADRLQRCNPVAILDVPEWRIDPGTGKVEDNPAVLKKE